MSAGLSVAIDAACVASSHPTVGVTGANEVEAASGEPGGRITLTDGRSLAFERWGWPRGRSVVWSPPAETPGWEQDLLEVNRRSLELVRHDRSALDHQLRATADRIREDPTEAIAGMMDDGPPPDAALLRRDDVVAMLVESMREAFATSHHGWFDDTVAVNSDWGFSLGEIEVPVLVFHGELDRNAPTSQARTLVAELPHAELTVFPDLGHISLLDRADDIVAQLTTLAPRGL